MEQFILARIVSKREWNFYTEKMVSNNKSGEEVVSYFWEYSFSNIADIFILLAPIYLFL